MCAQRILGMSLASCVFFAGAQLTSAQQGPVPNRAPGAPGAISPGPAPGATAAPGAADRGLRRTGPADMDRSHGSRLLRTSQIIGSRVLLQDGAPYGAVSEFVIGDNGCVDYAVVAYNNRWFAIPWGAGMFDFERRAFVLDIPRNRIRDVPTFTTIAELNNAQFQNRVHTFFRGNMHNGEHPMNRGNNGVAPGHNENGPQRNPGATNPGPTNPGAANRGETVQPGTPSNPPRPAVKGNESGERKNTP